nr:HTH domain-containing protein [Halomicroarcula sp. YJ-61-S]
MAGTSEIAEEVGCTRRTAYTRLQSLEADNRVSSRKVGNSLVWTVEA